MFLVLNLVCSDSSLMGMLVCMCPVNGEDGWKVGLGFLIALSCDSGYRVQVLLGTKLGHTQHPGAITSEISNGLGPFCCDRKEAPPPVAHEALACLDFLPCAHC